MSDQMEKLKKDNEALKERCFVLTQGSMCLICTIDCARRLYRNIRSEHSILRKQGDEDGRND